MVWLFNKKIEMPSPRQALPGREERMPVPEAHFVNGHPLEPPFPEGMEQRARSPWAASGAPSACSGRRPACTRRRSATPGGFTPNPTYEEVCSGLTGHTEVVLAVFDPSLTSYEEMLRLFWENHDPTQGMRQGNDVGTQYRSAIYTFSDAQHLRRRSARVTRSSRSCHRLPGTARSRRRSSATASSSTPSTTTSSTSRRCQTAIAVLAGPGLSCPTGSRRGPVARLCSARRGRALLLAFEC